MKPNEVIKFYGNEIKTAANIGVSITTVRNWIKAKKVPRLAQLAIQTLTGDQLKADQ